MDYLELSDALYRDAERVKNGIEEESLRLNSLPKENQKKHEEIIKCYARIYQELIDASIRIRQIGDFA